MRYAEALRGRREEVAVGFGVEPNMGLDNSFRLNANEKKICKSVNRKKEDELVREYVQTRNMSILEELYVMREPTLHVMARKWAWLETPANEDDMFTVFKTVWRKCVEGYNYEAKLRAVRNKDGSIAKNPDGTVKMSFRRTQFNTYFFSSMLYIIRNMRKRKNRPSALDAEGHPICDTMIRLDAPLSDGDDSGTFYDVIAAKDEPLSNTIDSEHIIKKVAGQDGELRSVLRTFLDQRHIRKVSLACKLKRHVLHLDSDDYRRLRNGDEAATAHLQRMVLESDVYKKPFRVLNYAVYPGRVEVEIYVEDSGIQRRLAKAIDGCRDVLVEDEESE
jgi:hypothetical protein